MSVLDASIAHPSSFVLGPGCPTDRRLSFASPLPATFANHSVRSFAPQVIGSSSHGYVESRGVHLSLNSVCLFTLFIHSSTLCSPFSRGRGNIDNQCACAVAVSRLAAARDWTSIIFRAVNVRGGRRRGCGGGEGGLGEGGRGRGV